MRAPPTVSFLSDYGHADEFVGVCHGVMRRIEPALTIIDLTHEVAPHDVQAGALALARAVQYLPECVVLAVVDPGAGTARRAVAVAVAGGFFVGPDNGLLAPAVAMAGGAEAAVELTNPEYRLEAPGPTFDGRDVFAPAAAHLAAGVALDALGPAIDPMGLQPATLSLSRSEGGSVHGQVLWVDRFGNAQLNIDPEELVACGVHPGGVARLVVGESVRAVPWVRSYGDAKPGELLLHVDSHGMLALAVYLGSASSLASLVAGTGVSLGPLEE